MGKNRVSVHRGKKGGTKHNDHDWKDDKDVTVVSFHVGDTLTESELNFYRERYAEMVERQNEKYMMKRNYSRCKTVEQIHDAGRYKPTEEIIQYGGFESDVMPSRDEFDTMVAEYVEFKREWSEAHGGHLQVLNYACHHDETTPHAHVREIWDYEDEDGVIKIGQEKAMEQAGLKLPNPDKPVGRNNNRGMTWTAMCREKWMDICEEHGFEVERVPNPRRGKGESIEDFQARMDRQYVEQAENKAMREEERAAAATSRAVDAEKRQSQAEEKLIETEKKIQWSIQQNSAYIKQRLKDLDEREERLKEEQEKLESDKAETLAEMERFIGLNERAQEILGKAEGKRKAQANVEWTKERQKKYQQAISRGEQIQEKQSENEQQLR